MGFVLRRSLPSLTGLLALLVGVGFAGVVFAGAPVWFPMAFAVVLLLVQFAVNPLIIEWLVPADVISHDGTRYDTDHAIGAIVAARCRQAGIPLVTLGIVDDGTPNAFTFGRTQSDARMWVTRGLLERLDQDELDAVVAHEVGHVKHWDFAVMTLAAVVPMTLYLVFVIARGSGRGEARAVAIGAYLAYLISQVTLLSLSRSREYAADHWSCEATEHGDALCSALVKVAYGMGQADAERKAKALALRAQGKAGRRAAAKAEGRWRRSQSMRAMGIFEPSQATAVATAFASGIDPERALGALRWDVFNPWARVLETFSSHPLVAHRIQALDDSGLPGAPSTWSVLSSAALADADPKEIAGLRQDFATQVAVAAVPWVLVAVGVVAVIGLGSLLVAGISVAGAGAAFVLKQSVRYPKHPAPVDEVTDLLSRLDAGPVAGIAVQLRGQIIGRGTPGYVLSPDLVVQDASGFLPLLYRQPIPFARAWFGLFRADQWMGQEVTVTGWYRRGPGPVVELGSLQGASGRARTWEWVARTAAAWVCVGVGVVLLLASMAA